MAYIIFFFKYNNLQLNLYIYMLVRDKQLLLQYYKYEKWF